MITRLSREAAGGVLSFTFLDVLTCTMGSLVLLVVVLGEKASDTRLEDALRAGPRAAQQDDRAGEATASASPLTMSAGDAAATLAALRDRQTKLAELRKQAAERLDEETARVSHLEEHERRLEHEIGQLYITLQRLEEAESKQTVDQATAERDLQRLKKLIADTENELADMRAESSTNKSYAIVPYQGRSGTYRRPIYIECTADSIVIQPEGVEFMPWDFMGPLRSGNPLASALRAAREELNHRAQAAGVQELPDAYPLILVRPNGGHTYRMVVAAVESWDVQFGYEMVDADWELEFPEPDPRLAEVMAHAVDKARQRQSQLARAAPRTYGAIPTMPSASGPGGAGSSSFNHSADLASGGSEPAPSGRAEEELSFAEEVDRRRNADPHHGEIASESGGDGGSAPMSAGGGAAAGSSSAQTAATGSAQLAAGGAAFNSTSAMASTPPPNVHQAPAEAKSPDEPRQYASEEATESAAATRGANWANGAAKRKASPITRPIHVLVGAQQVEVPDGDNPDVSVTITFDQSTGKVLDELAGAVKRHIDSWGLAGASMYWRPTLVIEVAPGAERHAIRLRDLLRDSGLDVRFQETETAARSEELPHAAY
jgi:hypothetical protein